MTGVGPTSQPAPRKTDETPAASPAAVRAQRMSAANMLRSLLPLVVICLLIVAWAAFRQNPEDPVREVDPRNAVSLAADRAGYPLMAPEGLPEGFRPTSVRTDAGVADPGDAITLEIGYLTPSAEYAGFVISDDPRAEPVTDVLRDAEEEGTVDVGGRTWTRSTTARGETALSRDSDGATVLVTGSAPDEELETVAAAIAPPEV